MEHCLEKSYIRPWNKSQKIQEDKIISSIFSNHNGMKLELNRRESTKFTNTWKLNNALPNHQWIKEESKGRGKKKNENKTTTYQNLSDKTKAVLRGKFIAINACIKKKERSQTT